MQAPNGKPVGYSIGVGGSTPAKLSLTVHATAATVSERKWKEGRSDPNRELVLRTHGCLNLKSEDRAMGVVFDIRTSPFSSWFGFAPIVLLALGVLLEIARRRRDLRASLGGGGTASRAIILLASMGVLMINFVMIVGYHREKAELVEALETNRSRVLTGQITEYRRQAWSGKPMERFRLGEDRFSFDGFGTSPAYHRRAASGGKLRDGLRVRLWEFQGNIVRIEVLNSESAPR